MKTKKQRDRDKIFNDISEKSSLRYNKKVKEVKNTLTSFMSSTKWQKLFDAIEKSGVVVTNARMCDIVTDELYPIGLEISEYNPKYTIDGWCAPCRLDTIKYILITCKTADDMDQLIKAIDAVGKYEYELQDLVNLRVWGYR